MIILAKWYAFGVLDTFLTVSVRIFAFFGTPSEFWNLVSMFFDTIEFTGFLLKFHEKCEQIKKYLDQLKKQ